MKAYTVIDIETTGGDPRKDRITEIAVFRYEDGEVVDQFTSLVNPCMPIPAMITRITGIDNEMVATAPRFFEIARRLVEITTDAVFVAHNVRFDYSFIQREFRNLGYTFTRKQLCTIRLSKKIMPGLKSYSLGKICKHLDIPNNARHRAEGDAMATLNPFPTAAISRQQGSPNGRTKPQAGHRHGKTSRSPSSGNPHTTPGRNGRLLFSGCQSESTLCGQKQQHPQTRDVPLSGRPQIPARHETHEAIASCEFRTDW